MDEELASSVSLLGRAGPWGSVESGQLTLADGVVTFTTRGGRKSPPGTVFSVPVDEVKAHFPRLGLGLHLTVRGKRYRFWFVSLHSAAGQSTVTIDDPQTIVVGNAFNASELGPARSTARQWRAALSSTRGGPDR